MEEHPFLLRKSFLGIKKLYEFDNALDKGMLTDENIKSLNEMAKKALSGEDADFVILTKAALFFHERYGFYLENFEISRDYYLSLAELFSEKIGGKEGKFFRYKVLRYKGNFKGALKLIDSLAKEEEKYSLEKASLLLEMGERDAALDIYAKNLKDENSWEHFADTLYDLAEYEDAIEAYKKVLDYDAHRWDIHFRIGKCFMKLGNYDKAIEHLENVIEFNKYHLESYRLLYKLYGELDMEDKRRDMVNKVKRLGFDVEVLGGAV